MRADHEDLARTVDPARPGRDRRAAGGSPDPGTTATFVERVAEGTGSHSPRRRIKVRQKVRQKIVIPPDAPGIVDEKAGLSR
jgi:hypothetical protein